MAPETPTTPVTEAMRQRSHETATRQVRDWHGRFSERPAVEDLSEREMLRFWSHVDAAGDCWVWTGSKDRAGYGRTWRSTAPFPAHRVAYELLVGPIPAGLVIDHLCRNPACVNPDHLEPVTHRVNILRGHAPSIRSHRMARG